MAIFDPTPYHITFRPLLYLLLGAGTLALGTIVMVRERWSRGGIAFWFYTAPLAAWLLSFGMAASALERDASSVWYRLGETGVIWIPSMILLQALSMAQRERELRKFLWSIAGAAGLFTALLHFTDHFFLGLDSFRWGWHPRFGWLGALFLAYFALTGGAAMRIVLGAYRNSTHPRNRARLRLVLIAQAVGFLAAVDFAPCFGVPLYPFGFLPYAANFLLTAWIIWRYRLMDIRPDVATGKILETMQGAVIVADLENRMRLVNHAAQELLGRTSDELEGKDLGEVLPVPAAAVREVDRGKRTGPHEVVWSVPGRSRIDVNLWASPILDGRDSALVGTVYVMHDVTERKWAEEQLLRYSGELQEANRRLKDLDRLKSEFVSTVSHELRTPLTSIRAFAEILLIKPGMPAERKERLLQKINDESDRLGRLINDLLDLSRIEAGNMVWRPQQLVVRKVVEASVEGILPLAQDKGLTVRSDLYDPLPELYGDQDRLVQVMTNLLSNAVKFTPAGGAIAVAARQGAGAPPRVLLSVSDNGAGISPEDLPHIFDKYHRGRNAEAGGSDGTGLGLSIARQIVAYHDGTISVDSTPGRGTTFTITLPAAAQENLPGV